MRTIEIKAYKFDELSDEAKEKAIEKWRETTINNGDYWFLDEATETFKKFADLFNIDWSEIDYENPYRNEYRITLSSEIKALSGWRLVSYLWNNYKTDLFKGEYHSIKADKRVYHPRVKCTELTNKGRLKNWHCAYYSAIFLDHSCVLTGVCYDDDILKPIYEYLDKPNNRIDFEDLLNDCIYSLCHSVQSEIEYTNSDEAIIETIDANNYEFTEDGTMI